VKIACDLTVFAGANGCILALETAFFHRLRDPAGARVVKGDPASSGSLIGKDIGVMEGKIKGNGARSSQPIVRASVLPAHVENGHVQDLPH